MKIFTFTLTLFTLYVGLFLLGCKKESPKTAVFIIPDGFEGIFKVVLSENNGESRNDEKKNIYRINDSGVCVVSELGVIDGWHNREAEYTSGQKIMTFPSPEATEVADLSEQVLFFSLVRTADDEFFYLIGNMSDYERLRYKSSADLKVDTL